MGSKAVAPPNRIANKSSEIAPSMTGRLRIKAMPPNSEASVSGSRDGSAAWARRMLDRKAPAPKKQSAAAA